MLTMVRDLDKYNEGYDECYQECYQAGYQAAYQEIVEMVLNMIDDGVSYKIISKYSNISIEEIENIRENHLNAKI